MNQNFTQADFDFTQEFAKFILNRMHVKDASVKDMIDFNKMLIRYNDLSRKIEANILELGKVVEAPKKAKSSKAAAPQG